MLSTAAGLSLRTKHLIQTEAVMSRPVRSNQCLPPDFTLLLDFRGTPCLDGQRAWKTCWPVLEGPRRSVSGSRFLDSASFNNLRPGDG